MISNNQNSFHILLHDYRRQRKLLSNPLKWHARASIMEGWGLLAASSWPLSDDGASYIELSEVYDIPTLAGFNEQV